MLSRDIFERFSKANPNSVMTRALLEQALSADFLDDLFRRHAQKQRPSTLLFSAVVDLLTLVVCRVRPSVHAAYQAREEKLTVAAKSVYNKLNCVETQVSRQLVRETAQRLSAVTDELGVEFPALVHRCLVDRRGMYLRLDGFHVDVLRL